MRGYRSLAYSAAVGFSGYLAFDALRGTDGKTLWSHRYEAQNAPADGLEKTGTNVPVSLDFVQASGDPATDLLVGLGTIVTSPPVGVSPPSGSMLATTRTVLVDGAEGSETVHPIVDVGVNWIPHPSGISDTDGDGLDDYVVINNIGLAPGGDPGEGQPPPPELGGVIHARKGTDGRSLWTSGGHAFYQYAMVQRLPDVVGGGAEDFAILTTSRKVGFVLPGLPLQYARYFPMVMMVDSSLGDVRWMRRASGLLAPGDVDHRGSPDVVLERTSHKGETTTYKQIAYTGAGTKIWVHDLQLRTGRCPLLTDCQRGNVSFFPIGDVHPDGIKETYVGMGPLSMTPSSSDEYRTFVFDGDRGRPLIESDLTLTFPSVALDGRGVDIMNNSVKSGRRGTFVGRDGSTGDLLWRTTLAAAPKPLGRDPYLSMRGGFYLPGDSCGDVVVNLIDQNIAAEQHEVRALQSVETLYGVLDGGSGKLLWSEWTGAAADRPRVTEQVDSNPAC